MSTGKMRIYGCGGAGINLASFFDNASQEKGVATLHPVYMDTSRSNLRGKVDEENCFILQNVDGSGKRRAENHQEIANNVRQALLKHKPMDFNVVVFSASGGSGSVFGPLILAELLERGEPAVAVVVGSDESAITADNTMKTLKSLDAISRRVDVPLVMYYAQNDRRGRRSDVDAELKQAIAYLGVLCSRENEELDSRDILHWLQYNKTTTVQAGLSLLTICASDEDVKKVQNPISIASILASVDEAGLTVVPEYHCSGYARLELLNGGSCHFVISVDDVPSIATRIQATLRDLEEVRQSRVNNGGLVGGADEISDTGLVL